MSFIREVRSDIEREAVRLLREYRSSLFREAVRLCGDVHTAEDLVMRTIETFFAKREDELPPDDKTYSWLRTTLQNLYWNMAYHPYPYPMVEPEFWDDHNTGAVTGSIDTKVIDFENLNVLTDYLCTSEYLDPAGNVRRVILSEQGFTDEDFKRITAPIGLPIRAETPAEIAISVAAQMIEVRAGKMAGEK